MNKKIWLSLSVGLCVGMIPAVAQAQASGTADESSINDIVVTANKREETSARSA